ncbi:D-2-hydroxyacid dehydrogenase family protein [Phytohalomonas tamaricis]|uniref:D-2-hydroxyacid dehydrogenase family protein n=1 Tax=Phytohalomonas tamaricis TaxID=2081032 RepID=UPI000D0AEA85|nr:D-2-hydroxyacid dehydrogenase family protein [Phytohalomonas tamaricis]
MTLRCAILDDYQHVALAMADWSTLEPHIEVVTFHDHISDQNTLVETLAEFDIIVAMRERTLFPAALLERLPRLKLLITSGMRNAAIDIEAARARGIIVCGTGGNSEPPTELSWALILGLARHLLTESNAIHSGGPWQSTVGIGLAGKRLGLLGLGKIGAKMARIAQAFGMEVIAWSEHLTRERCDELGVERAASKEALLTASDIVSIHLVLSERTHGLIGTRELELMKPQALLINTSRAAIVDQKALIEALQNSRIAGAGLDVFDAEPLPLDHPLRRLPNVLATPHIGYVADVNYRTYFQEAVEDIEAFLNGKPVRTL